MDEAGCDCRMRGLEVHIRCMMLHALCTLFTRSFKFNPLELGWTRWGLMRPSRFDHDEVPRSGVPLHSHIFTHPMSRNNQNMARTFSSVLEVYSSITDVFLCLIFVVQR